MKNDDFNKIVEEQILLCKNLLISKGKEYNEKKSDRLQLFKVASILEESNPEQALIGMMIKHTISICQMTNNPNNYSIEKWEEKITDHINYLILLKALIIEDYYEKH